MLSQKIYITLILFLISTSSIFPQKVEVNANTFVPSGIYANSYTLEVKDLPPLITSLHEQAKAKTQRTFPRYSHFWNFRDGNYAFTGSETKVKHVYHNTGDYGAYMESTPEYDDDEDPKRNFINNDPLDKINVPPTGTHSTEITNVVTTLDGDAIRLTPNRSAVPGDIITFILSYTNCGMNDISGTVDFTFPNTVYEPEGAIFYETYHTESAVSITTTGTSTQYSWNFTNLPPNEVWHIFIKMKTISGVAIGKDANVHSSISLSTGAQGNCPGASTSTVVMRTGNSHDPNNKIPSPPSICPTPGGITNVKFIINFQNIGDGPANFVQITDDLSGLSPYFNFTEGPVKHFSSWMNGGGVLSGSTATWVFNGINLRGTNEPGYGTDFSVEDTKGWVQFHIDVPHDPLQECSALMNAAEIIFDCNAPIITDPAIVRIECYNDATSVCMPCQETIIELPEESLVPGGSVPQILTLDNPNPPPFIAPNDPTQGFNWYPKNGLSDDQSTNPDALEQGFYTLVVGNDACERVIYEKPITQISNLGVTASLADNCNLPTTINVDASGGDGNYLWGTSSDPIGSCNIGVNNSYNINENGTYIFQVADGLGNVAYDTVVVNTTQGAIFVEDRDCDPDVLDLIVSGGSGSFTIEWSALVEDVTNPGTQMVILTNNSVIPLSGTYFDEFGSGNTYNIINVYFPISIVDENGCSVPFTPNGDCIMSPNPDPCLLSFTQSNNYINGANVFIQTETSIYSNLEIDSGANVIFDAGEFIIMGAGFLAESGSDFTALINGCTPSSLVAPPTQNFYKNNNGNNEISISSFKVSPNPTTSYIIVQSKNLDPFGVKMYDVNGKLVKMVDSDGKNEKIDLSDLQNGIYFYQIKSNTHIEKGKVVIQR